VRKNIKLQQKVVENMGVQYVYDVRGKKTGVIIPIELWNEEGLKIEEVEKMEKEEVFKPSRYRGIYKNLRVDLEEEIRNLREEWVRV
jgi:hypothetical protein